MKNQKRPVVQMLEQLEQRYYTIAPELGGPPGSKILNIFCKHCNLQLRFDDNNHEQAEGAAMVFRKHLKTHHADLLKQEHEVSIEKL